MNHFGDGLFCPGLLPLRLPTGYSTLLVEVVWTVCSLKRIPVIFWAEKGLKDVLSKHFFVFNLKLIFYKKDTGIVHQSCTVPKKVSETFGIFCIYIGICLKIWSDLYLSHNYEQTIYFT